MLNISDKELKAAAQERRAAHWAETIRVKEELICPPFTHNIVKVAVRHFGLHHQPLLPYVFRDDEYDAVLIAQDMGSCYHLYDRDADYQEPESRTWRAHIEKDLGWTVEEYEAAYGVMSQKELESEVSYEHLVEALPRGATPCGAAYVMLEDIWHFSGVELPIGCLALVEGDSPGNDAIYPKVVPKVALTFLQMLLDWGDVGIKIVLEEVSKNP